MDAVHSKLVFYVKIDSTIDVVLCLYCPHRLRGVRIIFFPIPTVFFLSFCCRHCRHSFRKLWDHYRKEKINSLKILAIFKCHNEYGKRLHGKMCITRIAKRKKKNYGGAYQNKKAAEKDIYYMRNVFFYYNKTNKIIVKNIDQLPNGPSLALYFINEMT